MYGVRKAWRVLRREGIDVGRDQVGRLMRTLGLAGATRTKRIRTTHPAAVSQRPADLVERVFTAAAPNRLWVADLTYVWTRAGFVYTAFVVDVFSRAIVRRIQAKFGREARRGVDRILADQCGRRQARNVTLPAVCHRAAIGDAAKFGREARRGIDPHPWTSAVVPAENPLRCASRRWCQSATAGDVDRPPVQFDELDRQGVLAQAEIVDSMYSAETSSQERHIASGVPG